MSYSFGTWGGMSFSAPRYLVQHANTTYGNGVSNPLSDGMPHDFNRIIGQQLIKITNRGSGAFMEFSIAGGSNTNANGYIGQIENSANYVMTGVQKNCTITPLAFIPTDVRINRYQVTHTTENTILDFNLSFSPFATYLPTIQATVASVGNLATVIVDIEITFVRFLNV